MSASYIRKLVRDWCNSASAANAIAFHDTINVYGDHDEDIWFTIQFNSVEHEKTFCSPQYQEVGFVDFIFMAKSGLGDIPAVEAAEVIIPAMMQFIDTQDKFVFENHEPIQEYSRGDADSTYRIGVQVNYRYKS